MIGYRRLIGSAHGNGYETEVASDSIGPSVN